MTKYNQVTPEIAAQLQAIVGAKRFFAGDAVKDDFSHDEMPIYGKRFPEAVCEVESTEEVAAIMKLCNENLIPVTPRGAGTGLAGGAGFYECVLLGFLLILLTNRLLPFVEDAIIESARNMNIYVEFQTLDNLGDIIARIKSQGGQIYEVDLDRGREERSKNPSAVFSIRLPGRHYHVRVLAAISELESVYTIDEI